MTKPNLFLTVYMYKKTPNLAHPTHQSYLLMFVKRLAASPPAAASTSILKVFVNLTPRGFLRGGGWTGPPKVPEFQRNGRCREAGVLVGWGGRGPSLRWMQGVSSERDSRWEGCFLASLIF